MGWQVWTALHTCNRGSGIIKWGGREEVGNSPVGHQMTAALVLYLGSTVLPVSRWTMQQAYFCVIRRLHHSCGKRVWCFESSHISETKWDDDTKPCALLDAGLTERDLFHVLNSKLIKMSLAAFFWAMVEHAWIGGQDRCLTGPQSCRWDRHNQCGERYDLSETTQLEAASVSSSSTLQMRHTISVGRGMNWVRPHNLRQLVSQAPQHCR